MHTFLITRSYHLSNDFIQINGKLVTFDFIRRPAWTPGASAPTWEKYLVRDRTTDNLSSIEDAFRFTLINNEQKTTLKFVPFPSFNISNDPCGNWLEWVPFITTDDNPEELRILAIRPGLDDDSIPKDTRIATKIDLSAWNNLISANRRQHHNHDNDLELSPQQEEMVRRICKKIGDETFRLSRQIRNNYDAPRTRPRSIYPQRGRSRSPSPKPNQTTSGHSSTGQIPRAQPLLQMMPNNALASFQNLTNATAPLYAQFLAAQQGTNAGLNPANILSGTQP